jgi:hypothetical protein
MAFTIFAVEQKCKMKKITALLILLSVVFLLSQCKKEEEDWNYCNCGIGTWVGTYNGSGDYYEDEQPDPKPVEVGVVIEQFSSGNLTVRINAPDDYAETFYVEKKDSTYYITVNGNYESLNLNLKKKGTEYKLTGTAKNFHTETDENDSTFTVYDKVLSFDVLKNQQ